jgi:O-antigen/teichoic acid export membrane protein
MSLRREAIAGVKWTTLSAVGTTGAQLLQLLVLARLLRPDDFGLMGMVVLVIGFAQAYADAGVGAALVHRQAVSREQLSSLYWLGLGLGALICAVLWLGAPLLALFFRESRLVPLLRVVSLIFLVLPFGKQFELLLQRDLRFDLLAGQDLVATTAGAVAAAAAALKGAGVWAMVTGTLVVAVVKTIWLCWIGVREHRPALHFRRRDLDGFVGFGIYQMGERTVNFVTERLDQVLIARLLGTQALGYYSFAFNLTTQPVSRINPIVTKVAFPIFARVQHDIDRLRRGYLTVVRLVASVNAPLLFGLLAVGPSLVPMVFGEKWHDSILLVQILSLVALGRSIGNPSGSLLLARGRADLGFHWNAGLLLLTLPCLWSGAVLGGAPGAALALLLVQVVLGAVAYFVLIRPITGPCGREYALSVLGPTALAAFMAAAILAIRGTLTAEISSVVLGAQILAGAMAYLALLWAFQRRTFRDLSAAMLGHG